jgi:hypothetical protein
VSFEFQLTFRWKTVQSEVRGEEEVVEEEEEEGGRADESQFFKTGNSSREPEGGPKKERSPSSLLLLYWIPTRHTHTPGNGSLLGRQKIKEKKKKFLCRTTSKRGGQLKKKQQQQQTFFLYSDEQLHKQQEQNKYHKSTLVFYPYNRSRKKGARAPNFPCGSPAKNLHVDRVNKRYTERIYIPNIINWKIGISQDIHKHKSSNSSSRRLIFLIRISTFLNNHHFSSTLVSREFTIIARLLFLVPGLSRLFFLPHKFLGV